MADIGSLTGRETGADANGHGPPVGPRPLRRRQGLPGTRAVAGGLLVAAAAVGLFAAYARLGSGPDHSYVVARRALTPGTSIQPSDLALQPMALPPTLSSRAFSSVSDLVGTTLLAPLAAGELVQPSSLVAARAGGWRTLSFPVERTHLGALKPGERIDVVATYGTGTDAWTTVVVRQAQVVDLDRSKSSLGDSGPTVVTLAVDQPGDELALAHAVALGKLTVVVATGAPPANGPPPTYRSGPATTTPLGR